MTKTDPKRFVLDGVHAKEFRDWTVRKEGNVWTSPRAAARKHAREHGVAGMWRADGTLIEYYRDGDRIRVRSFKDARPITATQGVTT